MSEEFVMIPVQDWQDACNSVRNKTGRSNLIRSGEMASEINRIRTDSLGSSDKYVSEDMKYTLKVFNHPEINTIPGHMFSDYESLEHAIIPSVRSIGSYAFQNCESLIDIDTSDGVPTLSEGAFCGCKSLKSAKLYGETVPQNCFNDCISLESVDCVRSSYNSYTSIGYGAFCNCESLRTANCLAAFSNISDSAFFNCKNLTSDIKSYNLIIGGSSNNTQTRTIGYNAFYNCESITSLNLAGANYVKFSIGSFAFCNCISLRDVILTSVTSIANNAFQNCKSITNIDIPEVSTLETETFKDCTQLNKVTAISVTSVKSHCFYGCSSLEVVEVGKCSISGDPFAGCDSIKALVIRDKSSSKDANPLSLSTDGLTSFAYITDESGQIVSNKEAYIYLPSTVISSYKSASVWSEFADFMRVLEDYTVDGSTSGALDMTKI